MGGSYMPTYISLVNLTEQGIKDFKNSDDNVRNKTYEPRTIYDYRLALFLCVGFQHLWQISTIINNYAIYTPSQILVNRVHKIRGFIAIGLTVFGHQITNVDFFSV